MRKILGYFILACIWLVPLTVIYFQGGWQNVLISFIGGIICAIVIGSMYFLGTWLIYGNKN